MGKIWLRLHVHRQDLANAAITASRVGAAKVERVEEAARLAAE
jgi:hypothetical protein